MKKLFDGALKLKITAQIVRYLIAEDVDHSTHGFVLHENGKNCILKPRLTYYGQHRKYNERKFELFEL